MEWTQKDMQAQGPLASDPYDRWITSEGVCMAEFHHAPTGHLVRFPHQADFLIEPITGGHRITSWPTSNCDSSTLANLYHNQVAPTLGYR